MPSSWFSLPRLNASAPRSLIPTAPAGRAIPPILHQTHGSSDLPPEVIQNIEALKALNPEFEYRFYSDAAVEEFIRTHYDEAILEYYHRINPHYGAARADLFRYLVIYKCGGVYLDVKSSFSRPLREVLQPDDRFLLSQWRNQPGAQFEGWGNRPDLRTISGGEYQQCLIIAAAGHPFIKAVLEAVLTNIDQYNPSLHGVGQIGVLRVTGPIAYTLAIAPLLHAHPHRLVEGEVDLGFVYSVFPEGDKAHRVLWKVHYTALTESVVLTTGRLALPMLAVANWVRRTRRDLIRMAQARPQWWREWRIRRASYRGR